MDYSNQPRLRKAIRQYQKYHPQLWKVEPDMEEVIKWLLVRSGMDKIDKLSKRLKKIERLAYAPGIVDPLSTYSLKGEWLIKLRSLAGKPFVVTRNEAEGK
jgi:hypothetical protein